MNFLTQLPDFEPWKQNGSSLEDAHDKFCSDNRRIAHLLCAIPIFWPDFVVKDDLLLRKDVIPSNWDEYMESANHANWLPYQIEYVLNHIHLADLFSNDPSDEDVDVGTLDFLASTIADMWKLRLQSLFPERAVVVEVNELGVSPEVGVYTLPSHTT